MHCGIYQFEKCTWTLCVWQVELHDGSLILLTLVLVMIAITMMTVMILTSTTTTTILQIYIGSHTLVDVSVHQSVCLNTNY